VADGVGVGEGDGVGVGEGVGEGVAVADGLGVIVAVEDGTGVGDALRNVERGNPSDIEVGNDQATPWGVRNSKTPTPEAVTSKRASRDRRILVRRGAVFFIIVLAGVTIPQSRRSVNLSWTRAQTG
jgi:hypothetical protein